MVEHTRREIAKILHVYNFSIKKSVVLFVISAIFALCVAFIPTYEGMSEAAHWSLFILLFSLGLWVSEAIPAFSVSLLLIGLQIVILGATHGVFVDQQYDWKIFIAPWSSSLIFLFLSGFILASGVAKTQLDRFIANKVLAISGDKPKHILFAIMGITFVFSMFVSNTATTVMMLAIVSPLILNLEKANPFSKAILLGIASGANLGGMGTIIGTPPNAIAVGALGKNAPDFLTWMFYALPPAAVLLVVVAFVLLWRYPSTQEHLDITLKGNTAATATMVEKYIVITTFIVTLLLWLSSSLHHIPTAVVAFLPIVVFTATGVLESEDMRKLPWDVLFLIVGGLSLGIGVSQTGLATYIAKALPFESMGVMMLLFSFSYLIIVISNFMSNTAATNILIPILVALVTTLYPQNSNLLVGSCVVVALSASNAMLLPVSTPPNALVYSTNKLASKEFLFLGVVVGIIGPLAVLGWLSFIFNLTF